jgi:Uma2 family endonuclease
VSLPAARRAIAEPAWLAEVARRDQLLEIVGGEFVVRGVPGNQHNWLAVRIAEEFRRQWNAATPVPGSWVVSGTAAAIRTARIPDVLVLDPAELSAGAYYGSPLAVVEVWSANNTVGEMVEKRREYREAGAQVFVEAFLTDTGDVHLEWLVNAAASWVSHAAAVGRTPLQAREPRPFSVVPNTLLQLRH